MVGHPASLAGKTSSEQEALARPIVSSVRKSNRRHSALRRIQARSVCPSSRILSTIRYADVEKFTGNANVFLTRALQNGLVERIARGVYVNAFLKNRPAIEEVACFLRTPSYISCEWALNHHGILLQSPVVCTVP